MTSLEVPVGTVVDLLVRREYEAIERMTEGVRMSAAELRDAISEYGRTLVRPDWGEWCGGSMPLFD